MQRTEPQVFFDDIPFTAGDIVRLTECKYQNLRFWVEQGIIKPTNAVSGTGHEREFAFSSVLAVFVVEHLRRELGLTPKRLRPVIDWIAGDKRFQGPRIHLARIPDMIHFDGKSVIELPKTLKGDAVAIGHGVKQKIRKTGNQPWRPNALLIRIGDYVDVLIERIKDRQK